MRIKLIPAAIGCALLLAFEIASPIRSGIIGDAEAIIGRPLTPVSYAGVARRTAYRGAAATSAAAAAASSAAAAAPPPPPPAAPAATAQAGAALAVGTIVGTLPAGCVSAPVSGIEYYLCGGTYYRPSFQGNNLVYVVQKP